MCCVIISRWWYKRLTEIDAHDWDANLTHGETTLKEYVKCLGLYTRESVNCACGKLEA